MEEDFFSLFFNFASINKESQDLKVECDRIRLKSKENK